MQTSSIRSQIALLFPFWYNVFSRVLHYVFCEKWLHKKCEYNKPVQVSCRDISSCTGSTVGFHHRCQTSVFLKNLCCPWDPEHWTHQNHATNQSTGKECTSPFNKSMALFYCLQSFWRDEPWTFVGEDYVTSQKNVYCYTSTYTVSSFSLNSRNSRLTFVLKTALSWYTRKTQQKEVRSVISGTRASAETQATHSWVAGFVLGASVLIFPDCLYRFSNIEWERKARGKALPMVK